MKPCNQNFSQMFNLSVPSTTSGLERSIACEYFHGPNQVSTPEHTIFRGSELPPTKCRCLHRRPLLMEVHVQEYLCLLEQAMLI